MNRTRVQSHGMQRCFLKEISRGLVRTFHLSVHHCPLEFIFFFQYFSRQQVSPSRIVSWGQMIVCKHLFFPSFIL
uniref:Uncharacterized protein LOC105137852 n=1 Tax=Rhizophora mucronata TaxID=61149 RepID=A0A2P2MD19_RHIMU